MTMSSELRKHFGQLEGAPRSKIIHNTAPIVTCDPTQPKQYFAHNKTQKRQRTLLPRPESET
jgi:hypothetical protein